MRAVLVLAGFLFFLVRAPGTAAQGPAQQPFRCFEEAPGNANRSNVVLRVSRQPWQSHNLFSTLVEIALREFLGYTVEHVYDADPREWVADIEAGLYDIDAENWHRSIGTYSKDSAVESGRVHAFAEVGYSGRAGLWTFRSVLAHTSSGRYFKYFQNATRASSEAGFLTFQESTLRTVLGTDFPACDRTADAWCGSGSLEGYWAPPACLEDPGRCVEIFSSSPALTRGHKAMYEQVVRSTDMEAVFGYYGDKLDDHLVSLKLAADQARDAPKFPIFFSVQPNPLLIKVDAVRIDFDECRGCHINCNSFGKLDDPETESKPCEDGKIILHKLLSGRAHAAAPEAARLLTFLEIDFLDVEAIFREVAANTSSAEEMELALQQATCGYITSHMDIFTGYMPDCVTNPQAPDPRQASSTVFNPATLECETTTVYWPIPTTSCFDQSQLPAKVSRQPSQPIRIVLRPWATHETVSRLTEVLLRDYLGYSVELVYNNKTHRRFFDGEIDSGLYDLDMEVWLLHWWADLLHNDKQYDYSGITSGAVNFLGLQDYEGRFGWWILEEALDIDETLSHFEVYGNASEVMKSGIRSHADSPLRSFNAVNKCTNWWCGSGDLEGYWAPFQCRDRPGECVEIMVEDTAYYTGYSEAMLNSLNLEMVVGYYGSGFVEAVQAQVGSGRYSPFIAWDPSEVLAKADAVRLRVPMGFDGCASKWHPRTVDPDSLLMDRCGFGQFYIFKFASRRLDNVKEALYGLRNMALSREHLMQIIRDSSASSLPEAVCDYIHSHQDVMQTWAPSCVVDPLPVDEVKANDSVFFPHLEACAPVTCQPLEVISYSSELSSFFCQACSSGFVPDNATRRRCVQCPAGQEVDPATGSCRDCEPGFSKASDGIVCTRCQVGFYNPLPGQDVCLACNISTFQDEAGATDCKLCELYLEGGVSNVPGATSQSDCACPAGSYLPLNASSCTTCPEGLACPFGSDMRNEPIWGAAASTGSGDSGTAPFPLSMEGYMTIPGQPLVVYECLRDEDCPGGLPGGCGANRDPFAVACASCMDETYPSAQRCVECKGGDFWPFALFAVIGVGVCLFFVFTSNMNLLLKASVSLKCAVNTGIVITALQTLAIFKQVEVDWIENLPVISEFLNLLSFDVKYLRLACLVESSYILAYTIRQLIAPVAVLVIILALGVKKVAYSMPGMQTLAELVNSAGALLSIFFISIVVSAVTPLVCYDHPGDAGSSVVSNPATLCNFEGDHAQLVAIGFGVALVVPVPFMALITYGILLYPHRVQRSLDSSWFLMAFRFLFMRFQPSAYWFGLVLAFRGLILCLIPAVVSRIETQIVLMAFVLICLVIVQQHIQPWRSKALNLVDGTMTHMLLMVLVCLPGEAEAGALVASALCIIIPAAGIVWIQRVRWAEAYYGAFICHHKADAGAQARLMKILLAPRVRGHIFIDSDNLVELDTLFNTVRESVKLLVVYLTQDTLRRPWCLGEITAATHSHGRLVTVQSLSFAGLPEEEAALARAVQQLLDDTDFSGCNLAEYGMLPEDTHSAVVKLVGPTTPTFVVDSLLAGSKRYEAIADWIVARSSSRLLTSASAQEGNSDAAQAVVDHVNSKSKGPVAVPGCVAISVDEFDDEAVAASCIMMKKIETKIITFLQAGVINMVDMKASSVLRLQQMECASTCIIILSARSLLLPELLVTTAALPEDIQTIPVNLWSFTFPGASYFDEEFVNVWPADCSIHINHAKIKIKSFLNLIAVPFSVMASDSVLETQARHVADRVAKNMSVGGSSSTRILTQTTVSNSTASRTNGSNPPRMMSDVSISGLGLMQRSNLSSNVEVVPLQRQSGGVSALNQMLQQRRSDASSRAGTAAAGSLRQYSSTQVPAAATVLSDISSMEAVCLQLSTPQPQPAAAARAAEGEVGSGGSGSGGSGTGGGTATQPPGTSTESDSEAESFMAAVDSFDAASEISC